MKSNLKSASKNEALDKLLEHSTKIKIDTKKWKWNREEIYDRKYKQLIIEPKI